MRIRSQRFCRIFNWKSGISAGILLAITDLLTSDTFLEGLMVSFWITIGFVVTVIWFRLLFLKKYFFCILCLCGFAFLCFHLPSVSCARKPTHLLICRNKMKLLALECVGLKQIPTSPMTLNSLFTDFEIAKTLCCNFGRHAYIRIPTTLQTMDNKDLPLCIVGHTPASCSTFDVSLTWDYHAWKQCKSMSLYKNWAGLPLICSRDKSIFVQFQDGVCWVSQRGFSDVVENITPTDCFYCNMQRVEKREALLHNLYVAFIRCSQLVLWFTGILSGIKIQTKSFKKSQ